MEAAQSVADFRIKVFRTEAEMNEDHLLVDAFFDEYASADNFPDKNEREDPSNLRYRVVEQWKEHDAEWNALTFLVSLEIKSFDGLWMFAGGMIVEYYLHSACLLLTYLFVKKTFRGQLRVEGRESSVAQLLLHHKDGMAKVVALTRSIFGQASSVLFESNHISRTVLESDSIPPQKRMAFFRRMGAMRVPFDYVQPSLEPGKAPVTTMMLCCFPEFQADRSHLGLNVVMQFLVELSNALDQEQTHPVYEGEVYFDDLARTALIAAEGPRLHFTGVAGGRNVLQDMYLSLLAAEDKRRPGHVCLTQVPLADEETFRCGQVAVSVHFVLDAIFSSCTLPTNAVPTLIAIPDVTEFETESGLDARCVLQADTSDPVTLGIATFGRVKLLQASLRLATALSAGMCVLHVTFSPAAPAAFSDLDIIKLAGLFRPGVSVSQKRALLFARRADGPGAASHDLFRPLDDFLFGTDGIVPSATGATCCLDRVGYGTISIGLDAHSPQIKHGNNWVGVHGARSITSRWLRACMPGDILRMYSLFYALARLSLDYRDVGLGEVVQVLAPAVPQGATVVLALPAHALRISAAFGTPAALGLEQGAQAALSPSTATTRATTG